MQRMIWGGVALFVVVIGGFFSLGLWAIGISSFSGFWGQDAYLGLILFATSVGLGAIVYLLSQISGQLQSGGSR